MDTNGAEVMPKIKKDLPTRIGEFVAIIMMLLIVIGLGKAVLSGVNVFFPYNGYTEKIVIQEKIKKAVNNGASLEVIRTIFSNRNIDKSFFSRWLKDDLINYIEPLRLSVVLDDMKAEYFLEDHKTELEPYLSKLQLLTDENVEINPFDKLESYQKDYFINIRLKISDKYELIENDVNKIADELNKQNSLVKEYLSDATTSLFLSGGGLIFALFIGLIQIRQSKKTRDLEDSKYDNLLEYIEAYSNRES
mgnify:CR=1 FL=1